jgi:hypothetical protein
MDVAALQGHFEVLPVYVKSLKNPIEINAIRKAISDSDIILIHGADLHAVVAMEIANIYRKKTIVVVEGYEIMNEIEVGYGLQYQGGVRAKLSKWVLRSAYALLSYTFCYWSRLDKLTKRPIHKIGGYTNPYKSDGLTTTLLKDPTVVLTIGDATQDTYRNTGIPLYNMLSVQNPSLKFYVIGKKDPVIEAMYGDVKYLGELTHDAIIDWLAQASVYCQFSAASNFDLNVIMAIQNECIPVYSACDGSDELIGACGYRCNHNDAYDANRQLIYAIVNDNKEERKRIATRYRNGYSINVHGEKLKEVIMSIYNQQT